MNLAFTTTFNANNIKKWSGTPFYMARSLNRQNISLSKIGGLNRKLPAFFKIRQLYFKILRNKRVSPRFNIYAAKAYSNQLANKISNKKIDAILGTQVNPIAYLNTKTPVFLWTDALYGNLINYYPSFTKHAKQSRKEGNKIVQECISRTTKLIFSSDWAALSAIKTYDIAPGKVSVVPFGANINDAPSYSDLKSYIKNRSNKAINLLFIGKSWERKGGNIAFEVSKLLQKNNVNVILHIIGCKIPAYVRNSHFVVHHGFLDKSQASDLEKFNNLLAKANFLLVPSRAEAFGIIFSEANAFGVPCITTKTGGIQTIIKNDINGVAFAIDEKIEHYCEYIIEKISNPDAYLDLCLSSYNEYKTRLNWDVATSNVLQIIQNSI